MAATVPSTEPTTNIMSPTCHACGQRFGQIKAPLLDLVPPAEDALTMEKKKKKKKKKKKNKLKDTAEVNKTTGPGVPTTLGNLLDYAQDWIPGYHFAKRVLRNFYRSTIPTTTALTIFSVYTVTSSSDPIVDSIAKKRKRPKHKKKTTSIAGSHIQEQPPKSKLPLSPSRRTCRRCHQVFKSRNELFKHLNARVCLYGASSTSIPKHTQADGTDNTAETAKAPKPLKIPERIKRFAKASSLRANKGKEAGLPFDSLKGGSLVAANSSPSPTTILKAASSLASPAAETPEAPPKQDIQERKQQPTTRDDLPCYPTDPVVEPEECRVSSPFWCRSCLDICDLSSHHQRFRFPPVQRELRTWPFGVEFALIPVPALSLHSPRNIGLPQDQCRLNTEVEDSSSGP